jgi:hypothetical protein
MNEEHKSEAVEHVAEAASHAIESAEQRAKAAEAAAAAVADSVRESEHGKRFEGIEREVGSWKEMHAGISGEVAELRKATEEMSRTLHELKGQSQAATAATLEPATLLIPEASKETQAAEQETLPPVAPQAASSEDTEGALHPAEEKPKGRPRVRFL